jgi:hypothetical protein
MEKIGQRKLPASSGLENGDAAGSLAARAYLAAAPPVLQNEQDFETEAEVFVESI